MKSRYHGVESNDRADPSSEQSHFMRRFSAVLTIVSLTTALLASGCQKFGGGIAANGPSLLEERRAHPTKLTHLGPAPQDYQPVMLRIARPVTYQSGALTLQAWLGIPNGSGPHPALLYCHGGFAFGADDFEVIQPFIAAGYFVLAPMFRGENGSPGYFERYFGEVNDALAALDYLRAWPGVDPKRVFVMGHSVGGTTAMLAAEMSPYLRGAAACGAFPNLTEVAESGDALPSEEFPFDTHDRYETDLRSPALFVKDLKCPLAIYNSDADKLYVQQAAAMQADAIGLGKAVTTETLPGTDHYTALEPAIQKAMAAFAAD